MTGGDIEFNFPVAAWLIVLLIPFFLGQLALSYHRHKQQLKYASPALLKRLMIPRSPILRWTKAAGWAIIWTLICFALMQPFGNLRYSSLSKSSGQTQSHAIQHEVILLVDTSASMRVADGANGQTRLATSKDIMEDILKQLKGQTVSLYTFTSELSMVVPPTLDYIFTRFSINDLRIDEGDVGGTRFAPVLEALKEQAFPDTSAKHYTIIMLSDGGDNKLESLTGTERIQAVQKILNAIPDPQKLHVRLFTVGIGELKGQPIPKVTFDGKPVISKLEPDILKKLASHDLGQYYMANAWTTWNLAHELSTQINTLMIDDYDTAGERKVAEIHKEDVIVDLYYQIPLALALLFYCLNLMLPDVRR